MAKITRDGSTAEALSPRGAFVTYPRNGVHVAQGWPPARPKQQGALGESNRKRFTDIQAAIKRMSGQEIAVLTDTVAELNKRNTGVRGESQTRGRDIAMRIYTGNMWALYDTTQKRTYYSTAVRDRVSKALDWMMPRLGCIVIKYQSATQPTQPGQIGWVLRCFADTSSGPVSGPPLMEGHSLGKSTELNTNEAAVSNSLDALGYYEGGLLYRGKDHWQVLAPGTVGQVLTLVLDESSGLLLPKWADIPT